MQGIPTSQKESSMFNQKLWKTEISKAKFTLCQAVCEELLNFLHNSNPIGFTGINNDLSPKFTAKKQHRTSPFSITSQVVMPVTRIVNRLETKQKHQLSTEAVDNSVENMPTTPLILSASTNHSGMPIF